MMEQIRELVFYKHYFQEFFDVQTEKTKNKIDFIVVAASLMHPSPNVFLRHRGGIHDSECLVSLSPKRFEYLSEVGVFPGWMVFSETNLSTTAKSQERVYSHQGAPWPGAQLCGSVARDRRG